MEKTLGVWEQPDYDEDMDEETARAGIQKMLAEIDRIREQGVTGSASVKGASEEIRELQSEVEELRREVKSLRRQMEQEKTTAAREREKLELRFKIALMEAERRLSGAPSSIISEIFQSNRAAGS